MGNASRGQRTFIGRFTSGLFDTQMCGFNRFPYELSMAFKCFQPLGELKLCPLTPFKIL